MISEDLILAGGGKCVLGETPLKESVSLNVSCFSVIYRYLLSVDDKTWLDRATHEAMGEMISDVDEVLKEAKAVVESARKQIPLRYKIISPFKNWLQKLK